LPANCASWSRHQSHIRSLSESKTTDVSQQLEQASSPPENLLVFYFFENIILLSVKNAYISGILVIG